MMSRFTWYNFKKNIFFVSYCPLQSWPLKTCIPDISKITMPMSFKFDQWIQDVEIILIGKLMVGDTVFHRHNFYLNK